MSRKMEEIGTFEDSDDFESSHIQSPISYNEEAKVLNVTFKNGAKYMYKDVEPLVFTRLCEAINEGESVGKIFNAMVKKGGYEYINVEAPEPKSTEEEIPPELEKYPTYSGVEVGMQWYDNTPEWPLEKKIGRAVRYYQKKFNVNPEHQVEVAISPDDFPADVGPEEDFMLETNATPIMIVKDKYQRKNYFLVGLSHV